MKKIYFLTRPTAARTDSGVWRRRLKNSYKSTDAIRDIIDWARDGKEFYVAVINHLSGERRVFHMNPPGTSEICTDFATKRPVVGVIDYILRLNLGDEDVDICLFERRRGGNPDSARLFGPFPNQ